MPFFSKNETCSVLSKISSFLSPITRKSEIWRLFSAASYYLDFSSLVESVAKFSKETTTALTLMDDGCSVQEEALLLCNIRRCLCTTPQKFWKKKKSAKSFFPHSLPFREEIRSNCFKLKVGIFFLEGKNPVPKMWKIVGSDLLGICPSTNPRCDFSSSRKVCF